jgi:hypothetical protein
MSKYAPLGSYLRDQRFDLVQMSFADIERIVGFKLPEKSQIHRAWWSNNPGNNVMTKIWVDAGFRTEQVDIEARRLVFRRVGSPQQDEAPLPRSEAPGGAVALATQPPQPPHPLFGALKGLLRVMPGTDLTEPADPNWGKE